MSMFAPQSSAVSDITGLHSFKAGKLDRVEGTNRVKADPRKGLVYLQEVDELLHFYWKDRSTGSVEDDLIIFPDEAEFVKVVESPSGRVFALKFSSSSQIIFFWMQEKDASKYEADMTRVNELIADPKAPAPQGTIPTSTENLGDLSELVRSGDIDLNAAAQTMGLSQSQLMQILGSDDLRSFMGSTGGQGLFSTDANASADSNTDQIESIDFNGSQEQIPMRSAVPSASASGLAMPSAGQQASIPHINDNIPNTNSSGNSSDQALRELLAGIQVPRQQQQQQQQKQQQQQTQMEELDLRDVLTTEQVMPLLANSTIRQQLFPHLPSSLVSDPPTEAEVREIMSSVQWRQALSGLSYALNNGGESVIRSLGLDPAGTEGASGVEAFLRALTLHIQEGDDRMEE